LTPAWAAEASRRRRKNTNCRGQPLHGQGIVEHNVSSSQEKEPWLGRTSQETLVSLSSTEPERKTSEEDRFFSTQEKRKEKTMEKTVREFVAVVQEIPWIVHLRKGFYAVNACTVYATYEAALTAERAALHRTCRFRQRWGV
jgi:hypothetical protein